MGWGYEGSGKRYNRNEDTPYGEKFGAGDIIGCGVDLNGGRLSFASKNLIPLF
jgi:hypothetical protein